MNVVALKHMGDCDNCGKDTHMAVAFDWGELLLCPECQQKLVMQISKSFEVSHYES
jgi:hypothetical protein